MARVLPEGIAEVSKTLGVESGTLADAIRLGKVPSPPLVDFNGWQKWRRDEGGKPLKRLGDAVHDGGRPTSQTHEGLLYRETMARVHGADWRAALALAKEAEQMGEEDEPEEAPGPDEPAAPAAAAGQAAGAGSGEVPEAAPPGGGVGLPAEGPQEEAPASQQMLLPARAASVT